MGARAVRRACVLGVAVVALAGCGSGGKGGTTTSSTTSNASTVTEDASLAAQVPPAIRQAGTIKVSTHVPFPPGELYEVAVGSPIIGFDPELMRAIAGVLGLKTDVVDESFDKILPNIENGHNTVGAASLTDTKGREKTVQMVTYLLPGEAFLTKPEGPHIANLNEICGHKVSALQHTVELEHILVAANRCRGEGKPKIRLSVFEELEEQAIPALLDGQTEILYADAPALEYQKRKLGSKVILTPAHFTPEPYGFVLAQNSGLAQPMVEALKVLMKDGTYAAILKRWHVQGDAISEPVIDGAIH